MNRKILILLFISIISVCLVCGMLGRISIAAEDPDRSGQAYERETICQYGMCYEVGRQWTSPEDMMRGEYYAPMTYTTMLPNTRGTPFSQSYEYDQSDIGGLWGMQPMMRMPVSQMSYMLGTIGASQTQMQQFSDPFFGSSSYTSHYPGLGIPSGAMLGPYRNTYTGGYSGSSYGSYGGGWGGSYGGGWGGSYGGGYPNVLGGGSLGGPWGGSYGGGYSPFSSFGGFPMFI